MILSYRTGRQPKKQPATVIVSRGPSTPSVERSAPPYDPFAAYNLTAPVSPKRKRGRPRKS